MKLFKGLKGLSTAKQRKEAAGLLVDIAELSNFKEARYYEKELLPYTKKHGYDKYLECLKEVKRRLEAGFRKRNEPRAIVASVVNKILA